MGKHFVYFLLWVLILTSIVFGSTIDISGSVRDTATGAPLSGAIVLLVNHGYADTTEAGGAFHLIGDVTKVQQEPQSHVASLPLRVGPGNRIEFVSPRPQKIRATAVNCRGITVAICYNGIVSQGKVIVSAPVLLAGYYCYVVEAGGNRYTASFIARDGALVKSGASCGITISSVSEVKEKRAQAGVLFFSGNAGFEDTIFVSVSGYVQKSIVATQPVITGLDIYCKQIVK